MEPRDHHGLAAAIVKLINDEQGRQRMAAAGFARVSERFTVERMVAETAKVYAHVAGTLHAADTAHPAGHG